MNTKEAYAMWSAAKMISDAITAVFGPGPNRGRMPA